VKDVSPPLERVAKPADVDRVSQGKAEVDPREVEQPHGAFLAEITG
jgi:hypothetical protein